MKEDTEDAESGHLEDKNPYNNDGHTPLHRAVKHGHLDMVKYTSGQLENRNPAKMVPNEDGQTPIHIAAQNGHSDFV